MLSFQRLDVYQRAIEFLAFVYDIVDQLPKGQCDRVDQRNTKTASACWKVWLPC